MTDLTLPALREAEPTLNVCHWTEDADPDFNVWQTDCGEAFTFLEDGPTENKIRFCCYCGLPVGVVTRPPEVLEDDDD